MNTYENSQEHRVLWVTNMMPPYRRGLWESLGTRSTLNIISVEGDTPGGVEKVRNSDWLTKDGRHFTGQNLRTFKFRRGETTLHFSRHLKQIFALVETSDVLVIGGWESPVYLQFMLVAKLLKKPFIIFHESTDASSRFNHGSIYNIKSRIFRTADAVVVPGRASHESVLNLGVPDERIYEGFNAVDMEHFSRPQDSHHTSETSKNSDGHKFLFVGRLIELKRVDVLIRDFSTARSYGDSLTIAGKGPELLHLETLVKNLGLIDHVFFVGEVNYEGLPKLFHTHHTLVLPSNLEVWGLVVNEALAAGLQVVVSRQCGVAASVKPMDGVRVWDDESEPLANILRQCARSWTGPIASPQILAMTNSRFADVIFSAIRSVSLVK